MRRKIWRALQVVIGLVVVGLAVRSVVVNWHSLQTQHVEWRFRPTWISGSVLVVFSTYAVLIEAVGRDGMPSLCEVAIVEDRKVPD